MPGSGASLSVSAHVPPRATERLSLSWDGARESLHLSAVCKDGTAKTFTGTTCLIKSPLIAAVMDYRPFMGGYWGKDVIGVLAGACLPLGEQGEMGPSTPPCTVWEAPGSTPCLQASGDRLFMAFSAPNAAYVALVLFDNHRKSASPWSSVQTPALLQLCLLPSLSPLPLFFPLPPRLLPREGSPYPEASAPTDVYQEVLAEGNTGFHQKTVQSIFPYRLLIHISG